MKLIALTGAIASGKSSVARALAERGYLYVDHAGVLKRLTIQALASIGVNLPMTELLQNKAKYRALLQEMGTVIGFDGGAFVGWSLRDAGWDGVNAAVIDNVRTDGQAAEAHRYGFQVVRLNVSDQTRWERLHEKGVSFTEMMQHEAHPIERGISPALLDLILTTDAMSPDAIAELLLTVGEGQGVEAYH